MSKKLAGKAALVTGGSRGIGAAIAKRLAADGVKVAITYVSAKDKADAVVADIKAQGGEAIAIHADSADKKAIAGAVDKTAAVFGKLDILVNNAGVFVTGMTGDPANDTGAISRQFDINVHGVAAAVNAAIRVMGQGGRIVSIGSVLGSRTPSPGLAEYSATKAAVAGYTRGWARDFGPKGITVNAIQPGPIDTDMNPDNGDFAAAMKATIPLGRYGRAEEVAAAVAFLVAPEAGYITGTTLDVDGGFNA